MLEIQGDISKRKEQKEQGVKKEDPGRHGGENDEERGERQKET